MTIPTQPLKIQGCETINKTGPFHHMNGQSSGTKCHPKMLLLHGVAM